MDLKTELQGGDKTREVIAMAFVLRKNTLKFAGIGLGIALVAVAYQQGNMLLAVLTLILIGLIWTSD